MREHKILRAIRIAAATWIALLVSTLVWAQVPSSIQEQIQIFDSLTPSQQQALIREVQRSLPPSQQDEILSRLRPARGSQTVVPPPGQQVEPDDDADPRASGRSAVDGSSRLAPGDYLVIRFELREEFEEDSPPEELQRAGEMLERLVRGNPYVLDGEGRLFLPGVPAIQLAGLDLGRAKIRVEAESSLRPFEATLTHLPLEPTGVDALEPFGYDFFRFRPQASRTPSPIPVPEGYVVGPGDVIVVQLFGNRNEEHVLPVSRDGTINFPEIGPITVGGLTFEDMRTAVDGRVAEQFIGVRASTTLGELRSIQVFVLGDVERPGAYAIPGLSTVTDALYASGGVKEIGSLRNIAVLREGQRVATLDLYDMLLRGDTRGDVRLRANDAILVPPIGTTVAVDGEVRRPAIYEVNGEQNLVELIELAGGFTANASRESVKLERIEPGRGRYVTDLNLSEPMPGGLGVRDGDVVRVQPNLDQLERSVRLVGNVQRPGLYQLFPGMKLSDLLPTSELLKPMSDLNYVLVRRETQPNVDVTVFSADLEGIWRGRPNARDVELQARDTVTVFNLDVGRRHVIDPLIEELRTRSDSNEPLRIVTVSGQVRAPGRYPLEPGMRVSDLLRAGGGMTASAYAIEAELARYVVVDGQYRVTELINLDLAALRAGDPGADVVLAPYDALTIREVPRWNQQQSITIRGEVQFPGTYPIRAGETLSSVLERAGGLTEIAFPQGSVFTRVELRRREAEQLETMARRIETDLAALALSDPSAADAISTGQTLIAQLRSTEAIGRLVINLEDLLAGRQGSDVVLRDGDQLFIPQISQEVMVLGEVQYATSHLYSRQLDRDDYIAMSGGMTSRADKGRIYVVRANGAVDTSSRRSRWFSRSARGDIRPGDTIVVPLDTDRVRPLVAWEGITQVLYNIAIAFSVIDRI